MRATLLLLLASGAIAQPLVVIDPGHGGRDPGAVGCGNEEAPSVLDISARTGRMLDGLRVELTREDDRFVELRARSAFANQRNATIFVSVHANANEGQAASGTETWIANNASPQSRQLAEALQREMVAEWGLRDRGVKQANFSVLANTAMPAALVETGFINHCQTDSQLLGAAESRQGMAGALARGIAEHLGADPPVEMDTGTLLGVVFEDLGAGLEDTSVRLGGARVEAGGGAQTSDAETGRWRFELAPGDYTVRVSLAGYRAAARDCAVAAGAETWCSVGLQVGDGPRPDATIEPDPDAGAKVPDAGAAEDMPSSPGDAARFEPDFRLGQGQPDVDPVGAEAVVGEDSIEGGCACNSSSSTEAAWLLALLVFAFRRRATLVAAISLMAFGAQAHVPTVPESGTRVVAGEPGALRLVDERLLHAGAVARPKLSPDARHVAFSDPAGSALFVMATEPGAQPRLLATGPRVGFEPEWHPDSRGIAYRAPHQSLTAVPLHAVDLKGGPLLPTVPRPRHLRVDKGVVSMLSEGRWRPISPTGDRFFQAVSSPTHVALWGLRSGLFVYRPADGALRALGSGGHPTFDPSGVLLVFERTTDEGAALTGGDLFVLDLVETGGLGPPTALTATADRIELWPSVAADRVVFVTVEGLWIAELVR